MPLVGTIRFQYRLFDREEAAYEVRTKTKLGRLLAQIEMRVVTHIIEEAAKQLS